MYFPLDAKAPRLFGQTGKTESAASPIMRGMQANALDLMTQHPFQPGFMLFADFDFRPVLAVERRYQRDGSLIQPRPRIGLAYPVFAFGEQGRPLLARNAHEIRNFRAEPIRHLEGGQIGLPDGVNQGGHEFRLADYASAARSVRAGFPSPPAIERAPNGRNDLCL